MTQVCKFADDTTFYVCGKGLNTFINKLENDTALTVERFQNNCLNIIQDKGYSIASGHKHETLWAK